MIYALTWHEFWTWLVHGEGYQITSGPVVVISLIALGIQEARKHNCHVRGCVRIGRHPVEGTHFVVCRKHHPEEHPKHYLPTAKEVFEKASDET